VASEGTQEEVATFHGGRLIARRLKAHGVSKLFTLSGGHLFSIYDGCREEGIEIVDVRHESTAAFAAEGWAKVTREPGVCALTAGPGVTNGMSAMASAQANHSPIVVLGGRAPALRWGQGSLQEIDHIPFVRPLAKLAATAGATEEISPLIDLALQSASAPHGGAAFVDFPLDYVFMEAAEQEPALGDGALLSRASPPAIERAGELLREAERPEIMAGPDLYWVHGEHALLQLAETLRIPLFLNGLARGCVPADHELFFSRARSQGLKDADVALGSASRCLSSPASAPRSATQRSSCSTPPSPSAPTRDGSRPSATRARRRAEDPRAAGASAPPERGGSPSCARPRTSAARPSAPSARTTARRSRCACMPSSGRPTATRS
jgi:acetolactate synthase-1/2/3 large subunit